MVNGEPVSLTGQFRTTSDQRYTVLELPYLGRSLSLQVILPSERKTPLSSIESQLSARQLASWDTGLRRTKMDIFLPRFRSRNRRLKHLPGCSVKMEMTFNQPSVCVHRFRMQNKFNLRSVLPAMGISDAFSPTAADFRGISGRHIICSTSTRSSS